MRCLTGVAQPDVSQIGRPTGAGEQRERITEEASGASRKF